MQILHPFAGSIQRYFDEIADPDRYRPDHCPQCEAQHPLTGHGFYGRTLVDAAFDGVISVRRYLCLCCKRTVSLLPEFVLPWLRFSISVIALFVAAGVQGGVSRVARIGLFGGPGMLCPPGPPRFTGSFPSAGSPGSAVFKTRRPP